MGQSFSRSWGTKFVSFLLIISFSFGAALASRHSVQASDSAEDEIFLPAQIREVSEQELRDMGIREEDFRETRFVTQPALGFMQTNPQNPYYPWGTWGTPGFPGTYSYPCPDPTWTPVPEPTAAPSLPVPPIGSQNRRGPIVVGPHPTPVPSETGIPQDCYPPGPGGGTLDPNSPMGQIEAGVVILERIVNLGRTIWNFIKDGKAVVNIETQTASALPAGVTGPMDLQGWEAPISKNYQVLIPNAKGDRKVEFVFRVSFYYGGSYKGKGRFLSNITVQAADYKVNWGQTFNVRARIPNEGITNVSKTRGNPVAAATIYVEWSREKIFSTQGNSAVIFVRGDGQIRNISAPDEEPEDLYPIGRGGNRPRR